MRKFINYSSEPTPRTLRLPDASWSAAKAAAKTKGTAAWKILNDGITKQLPILMKQLTILGIVEGNEKFKLVRVPLMGKTLAMLRDASKQTGLPAVRLLSLCLVKQVGRRRLRSAAVTAACPPSTKSRRAR